ncbi:MAG: hypothetical protein WCT24_02360 [Patescibacteria group bacterium]
METLLVHYARKSISPEERASLFVDGEPRLTWTSLLYADFPQAEIFLVGGTIRDVLLGRHPQDIDLVVRNVPVDVLEPWLYRHGAAEFVGRFGTFKFVPHGCTNRQPLDIALPRTEHVFDPDAHASGRKSLDVKFNSDLPIKEDLSRRDFTINAMAFELRNRRLIDPFLGLQDLHAGSISAVLLPEQRFFEDATRMLRALRLASQLGFGIEELTWRALKANIDLLQKTTTHENGTHIYVVPREMIGREFLLGFNAHPMHTIRLWLECRALHLFMPELARLEGLLHEDRETILQKTLNTISVLEKPSFLATYGVHRATPTLLLAALMSFVEDDKATIARRICTDYYFHQFPNNHHARIRCEDLFWLLSHMHDFETVDPASLRPSKFENMFLTERGRDLLMLMHATSIASGRHSVARERIHVAERIRERMIADARMHEGADRLPRLLTGSDLQVLGIEPGPGYRELLDLVRDMQLSHKIESKLEAEELVKLALKK